MAFPTTVTFTFSSEAQAKQVAEDLCASAGMPFTGPNAHAVVRELIEARVDAYRKRTAPIAPVGEIT
jgi:hypothetical protein